jgi:hypothetical protein
MGSVYAKFAISVLFFGKVGIEVRQLTSRELIMSNASVLERPGELVVKLPASVDLNASAKQSLVDAFTNALKMLDVESGMPDLIKDADRLALLIVGQVTPNPALVKERKARLSTMNRIIEEGEWLRAEEINNLQANPPKSKGHPVGDWKRRGRVFSVPHSSGDLFARYQFDAMYQPLPIMKEVIAAFGEHSDPWTLAAWMHFPNSWLSTSGPNGVVPVAPKDCLDRREELLTALSNRNGSYVA